MYWLPRKKVLVPTDFREASIDAMHTALAMVESGCCVHALHVVEPFPDSIPAEDLPQDFRPEESDEMRRQLRHERLESFLSEHDIDGLSVVVLSGEPALSITRYARENNIDLIVMAAHGYEQGERISMGTVTERVLHNTDCPVLVLRPDGRIPPYQAGVGVRESNGFAPVENPSHADPSNARPR
ncbi:MAG: universal stress protein [Rhodopirellula sp.]|nr:universal stress protein [Rhodopirellula sp.]